MDIDFTGKTALVTGAGKGIGRATAKLLAQCGADVIALTRTQSDLDSLKEEIPNLRTICVDLMNLDEALKAVEEQGTIDFLVNNAACIIYKRCMDITREEYEKSLLVNVTAAVQLTQVVARKLIEEQKPGAVVNISTIGTKFGLFMSFPYVSVKSALESVTRGFAVELAPNKIRVNCLLPGVTKTDFIAQATAAGFGQAFDAFVGKTPLNRMGKPEEVAQTIAYLLSDKASFVTGHCMTVDGGYHIN